MPKLTEELRVGTRALEGLKGLEWSGDMTWIESLNNWGLPCRISVTTPCQRFVPRDSAWWIRIDSTYPSGKLEFYPAKEDGIVHTFPHQRYNGEGDPNLPWRSGNLCLRSSISSLKRYGLGVEPRDAEQRLRWHVEAAQRWLEDASRGTLQLDGDRFELPDFPRDGVGYLAFSETMQSLAAWKQTDVQHGFVHVLRVDTISDLPIITRFEDKNGNAVIPVTEWGSFLQERGKEGPMGIWIRLPGIPVHEPWQAPVTWIELVELLKRMGIRVEGFLPRLLERRFRNSGTSQNTRPRHPLLFGFPIPEVVGVGPVRMHWIGFDLPPLAEETEFANGFRANERGRYQKDLNQLKRWKRLPWVISKNWNDDDLTGRGRLSNCLRRSEVLLIGAGALGSALAEILVRGGVKSLTVFDDDLLEAGNLVRHTLDLEDLGEPKAAALARRLERMSPHALIRFVNSTFPGIPDEVMTDVENADMVIDCTGEDSTLFHLERYPWQRARMFVSLSLGIRARRLYCFSNRSKRFERSIYVDAVTPWVEKDWQDVDEEKLPLEGVGCWNPLMPAKCGDIWLFAAIAVRVIDKVAKGDVESGELVVFERFDGPDGLPRVQRVSDTEASNEVVVVRQ